MLSERCDHRRQRFRYKSLKYVLLSVLLTTILLSSTGCTALLIGNNRKAYDLMVEASDYFKYPSSVQIVSGEMWGDSLYCVIRAKNGYGNYRSDTYWVSSSGYPLDDYDSRCYSDALNCDLINSALASHYGMSTTNVLGNLIGGSNMSLGAVVFLYIVIIVVLLCLNGYLASNASDIASDKGYEKRKWFHMCFWLGPISYIIIAAMPDRQMRSITENMINLQKEMISKLEVIGTGNSENQTKAVFFDDLPKI